MATKPLRVGCSTITGTIFADSGAQARGMACEVRIDGQWFPARFVALDLVGGEPIVQRDKAMPIFATWNSVRGLDRAALAAQSQGAQATDIAHRIADRVVRHELKTHSAIATVAEVELRAALAAKAEAPAAQQAAAPGASAQPHKIHELLRIYDEKNGDWCAIARAVESRYVDPDSAPGTPEAPVDCRAIGGDRAAIISQSTAIYALEAMEAQAEAGKYKMLFSDDASFVRAGMRELKRAAQLDGGQGEDHE